MTTFRLDAHGGLGGGEGGGVFPALRVRVSARTQWINDPQYVNHCLAPGKVLSAADSRICEVVFAPPPPRPPFTFCPRHNQPLNGGPTW